jgi:cell division protease FtsH
MSVARNALFPLLVIVLLVYLASQTFLSGKDKDQDIAYSELLDKVESSPRSIANVVFIPSDRGIRVTLRNGTTLESNYPTDASQLELQHELHARHIHFESRGSGTSAWWSILTYLLPFALFMGFWIFLLNRVQARRRMESPQDPDDRQDQFGGTSRY